MGAASRAGPARTRLLAKLPARTRLLGELPARTRLLAEVSVWSADLARLAEEITRVDAHADIYHLDAADGVFAPALLLFPDLVARLRPLTSKPFHVHLMVQDAIVAAQARQFAEAGADLVSVHAENGAAGLAALAELKAAGVATGVVLRVETPLEAAEPFLGEVDMVTLLGTAIGVKGQELADEAPRRIAAMRARLAEPGRGEVILAADGGIREHTVPKLRAAGADTVVMGSLAFGASDLAARMRWLHAL